MQTLKATCRLEIDDFGRDLELQKAIRRYNDTRTDYVSRSQIKAYLYSRLAA
jgi:hypothetical protein